MGYWGVVMQHAGYELPRISIPRTPVNRGKKKGRIVEIHREFITVCKMVRRGVDSLDKGEQRSGLCGLNAHD
jgi:hypothetical protein